MDLKLNLYRWLSRIFLIFVLVLTNSCKQEISSLGVNLKLDIRSLSNGLKIIMIEDHTAPVISYQTWLKVGSVDEQFGITGISHLFEHLMFKGTEKFGPKEFFKQLETKGAEVNAFTARDYTVFYETISPTLLEKTIEMEADRMSNLHFDQEAATIEKQVVLEERRLQVENLPSGKIQEALWALAFKIHPYKFPIIGIPSDVASLSLEQLENWYKTYYQPGNAVIVISGDLNPDATFTSIKKAYGPIAERTRPKRTIPAEPQQKEERRLILRDNVTSERFAWAFHITSALEDETYAVDVLANILFEGTTSRAHRTLVEEQDIALSVSGSSYTPAFPGLFILSVIMNSGVSAQKAEIALDDLIRNVQENGVSEEEVKAAIRQLTIQLIDSVRTPFGIGQLIGTVTMIFDDPKMFASDLEKYLKVTPEAVKKVAQKYLIPNNRSVVTLMSLKAK